MQFDEFDKKVKQAADHHHPAYDEQAWTKMEKLLKRHLPQKEDDRRRFLFLLLLFIGLGGAGLFIAKPWKKNNSVTAAQTIQQRPPVSSLPAAVQDKEDAKEDNTVEENKEDVGKTVTIGNNEPVPDPSLAKQPASLLRDHNKQKKINSITPVISSLVSTTKKEQPAVKDVSNEGQDNNTKNKPGNNTTTPAFVKTTNPVNDVVNPDKKQEEVATNPLAANTATPSVNTPATSKEVKKETKPIAQNTDKKTKNKKGSSFFFTLSAGPDMSFVAKGKPGETKLLAGAGLGYTFNNRFTIRTGFYSGRKIYTAPPSAYHPPAYFYTYYPNLEKVDADCKVYEIPLSLSYNFARSSKQNFFASAGVSSYLMKKETYTYFYKYYPTSPTISREWTAKDRNEYYFSTLTISGGYQRNLGKHITVMAEPYVKLPISGVGYGKVKLNSAGVLFTVGIKPFGAKKEKPRN